MLQLLVPLCSFYLDIKLLVKICKIDLVNLYKKARINFFFNNSFNFVKTCSIGDVLTVYYFILFGRKKRTFIFTGILLSKRKFSFELENCINSEVVKISFSYFSPNIVNIFRSDKYNFKFNKCMPALKKNLFLTVPNVNFSSNFFNVAFDIPRLVLDNLLGFFLANSAHKKKFKKIKKKFRY